MLAFAGKAETLAQLAPLLKSARILPMLRISAAAWPQDRAAILADLAAQPWSGTPLIVRSSASAEDRPDQSLAGAFLSLPDVPLAGLGDAVDRVIASFGKSAAASDAVLVQPMLRDVTLSGVAFTRDPNTGAPYLVIEYDTAGDTHAVTGGQAGSRMLVHSRAAPAPCRQPFDRLCLLADELTQLFGNDSLDIEFAFDRTGALFLFQVRPLAGSRAAVDLASHRRQLEPIAAKIAQANRPHPYLRGQRTLYGVMPDWNPAEIIGIRPRPLALSLYRNLVTDSVWAYQRNNYGYRNLRSFPLMLSFQGLPYIDVRVSFNSFIPGDIPDALADRLVDHYIDQLAHAPALHDKVEFEIVYSCYTFDLPERIRALDGHGFAEADRTQFLDSLRRLTNRVINSRTGLWREDAAKIARLEERQAVVGDAEMDAVSRIYWLMEDCKRYGTLPFAGLARAGFIAMQMLRSLVQVGVLDRTQYDRFLTSLDTISSRMGRDLAALPRDEFLARYGHLRPGTYDILSPRYDEAPDRYIDFSAARRSGAEAAAQEPFALALPQMRRLTELLREHHLDIDVVELFDFLQGGIQGREYAKFVFTRSLSRVLSLLGELGAQHGLSRDDMSYLDANLIAELYTASGDVGARLRESIAQGRQRHAETLSILLPPLIAKPEDVYSFDMPPTEPNFITQGRVEAVVRGHDAPPEQLKGAIVAIPSADPGFDWLFSRGIAGLITAYGGTNSHMAIRAGEMNLPAVIGAGETLYGRWRNAGLLLIDCANRHVDVLR